MGWVLSLGGLHGLHGNEMFENDEPGQSARGEVKGREVVVRGWGSSQDEPENISARRY